MEGNLLQKLPEEEEEKSGGFLYNIDPEQHHKTKISYLKKLPYLRLL
ncbi:MAG: hypothetical protein ACTHML_06795 [Ginsengibacter sp.]|jgi:hypothetical protein